MPPKKVPSGVVKAEQAKKQKTVEDKTFGLKNKNKSKTVQKYVQNLQSSVQATQNKRKTELDPKEASRKKKEEEAKRQLELNELFKVAISQPKAPPGVDPKSILCEYYRRGQCTKGFKCKYSHDLNVERKGEKIDLYSDQRDKEQDDPMTEWDQAKLEEAVASKSKEYNQNKPTDIICKHFLESIEKRQYGWFWACPNGGKACQYRHALPPGYVLKSQLKALAEESGMNTKTLEEEIEEQRGKLAASTPVTDSVFSDWKKRKLAEKEQQREREQLERAKDNRMSGRELFEMDASAFVDDEGAADAYTRDEDAERHRPSTTTNGYHSEGEDGRQAGPSSSRVAEELSNAEDLFAEDDDELDEDELGADELEELEAQMTAVKVSG
eukprot:jgi/Chlat1/153/Chrsp1S03098